MHINVRDILAESIGHSRTYKVEGENPHLESVVLTREVNGDITLSRLEGMSLLAGGYLTTEIELECHRCLRTFTRPLSVKFRQVFAEKPTEDTMPIVGQEIDLAPLLEQELILNLPIKILDRPDCPGIELPQDSITTQGPGTSIKDRAHITKGP